MSDHGFHTITLGCKLNQFDGAAIEGELVRRGYVARPTPDDAAVVVVNTCTVTHRADADARKLIRAIRRRNPHCLLLVTGCYAELEPGALAMLGGVDRVFGNRDKTRLPEILDEIGVAATGDAVAPIELGDRGCDGAGELPTALHFGERSRAFLKIQDGCRLACSYCVIPRVRGASRSVPAERVERALAGLLSAGYREVVLTGVNTGDWGRDLVPASDLASLLRRLLAGLGPNRLRLNSLEPLTIGDGIVELLAEEPRLAPHLQVPLQSGSPEILRRMRRNYRVEVYVERLERLRAAVPDIGLGADVIVGFPGETDVHFRETEALVESSPLNYLHVFSWSARPGTPAAGMDAHVDPTVIAERSRRLRALARRLGFRFRKSLEGRTLDAVALDRRTADGPTRALTGNFIEVAVDGAPLERGAPLLVRVDRVTPAETRATAVGRPGWARSTARSHAGADGVSGRGPSATSPA